MVEAIPELRVPFEKARATNTEAAEIAKLPGIIRWAIQDSNLEPMD